MSFSRLNYDPCTYMHNIRQSVGAVDYQIGTPMPHCKACFSTDPSLRLGTGGVSTCRDKPLIDVDSELMGITRQATNCPTQQFIPKGEYCSLQHFKDCRMDLPAEDTRISNPPCTLRGSGWNRWEWLCQDPQERVLLPFATNVNTNILMKDNHRPCVPDPIDPSLALPPHCMSDKMVAWDIKDCGKLVNNVPSVNWRSCSSIKEY